MGNACAVKLLSVALGQAWNSEVSQPCPELIRLLFISLLKEWPLEAFLYRRNFAIPQWLLSPVKKLQVS